MGTEGDGRPGPERSEGRTGTRVRKAPRPWEGGMGEPGYTASREDGRAGKVDTPRGSGKETWWAGGGGGVGSGSRGKGRVEI